jgi:hypothetical protein
MSGISPQKLRTIIFGLALIGSGLFYQYKEVIFAKSPPKPEVTSETQSSPSMESPTNSENNAQVIKEEVIRSSSSNNTSLPSETQSLPVSENYSAYINSSAMNKGGITVVILDKDGNISSAMSSTIASIYSKNGTTGNTGLIRSSFLRKHEFQELSEGNSEIIAKLDLSRYTDYIALGKINYTIRNGTLVEGTVICNASLSVSIISTKSKSIVQSFTINNEAGNGVTDSQAREEAFQKLISRYNEDHSSI